MCGIAGIVHFDNRSRVDEATLIRMRDTLAHRGPDGSGIWVSPNRSVGLAHRRAFHHRLELPRPRSPCAMKMPMSRVTYNGEMYNHLALRDQLLLAGHRFKTDHSDTEVIVHGYEQMGYRRPCRANRG